MTRAGGASCCCTGKRSIAWWRKYAEKGYTLIPLSLYEKRGRVKVELALVHGKQQYDRREDVKKREAQREMDRAMSRRRS